MIQSDKFDSVDMDIKKITNTAFVFFIKRLSEIFGVIISISGLLLFISLISYSPEDPNFIFPENMEIKNWLGFKGSYISDLFFQSIGLISFLFSITLIFTGINMFSKKDFFLIIENTFYSILYLLFGSLFFSYFYNTTFALFINGNGGFVGTYLSDNIFKSLINFNEVISYYFLIILILVLFLLSINLNLKKTFVFFKKIQSNFNKKEKNYTDKVKSLMSIFHKKKLKT